MNEREIFTTASLIEDPELRASFLATVCAGDADRLQRIESLLQAREKAGELIGQSQRALQDLAVAGENGDNPNEAERESASSVSSKEIALPGILQPGTQIGPYQILQLLGEGGMGVVYAAKQSEPVKRQVALKILRPGDNSRNVLARFEQERYALSMMEHSGIARILDAGSTADGLPYFVMELVKGIPINRYCDQENLSPQERLQLFIPVCAAVQHAHQKGIIHRDLKPSNILVALYDGEPIPKVIDFGVAKATNPRLADTTVYTEIGSVVGTLEYMAPEQAELNNLDIDTRADIYSLGVVLYELLTGGLPFSRQELRSAAFDEMLRIIREVEPPKPSTKVSSSEEAASVAAQRKLEPKQLAKALSGDLDWVVMKALEKDRQRRYGTAIGLADDLRRFLAGEPVSAGPPTIRYRFSKFIRRNRFVVIAASLILLALLGGFVGTGIALIQAVQQRDLKDDALVKLADQQQQTQSALEAERRAREDTLSALRTLTDQVVERQLARKSELNSQDRAFFNRIIDEYQRMAEKSETEIESRALQAEAQLRVGMLRSALGESPQAISAMAKAVALFEQLCADVPDSAEYGLFLTTAYQNQGRLLSESGKPEEALASFDRSITTGEKLFQTEGQTGKIRAVLNAAYRARGNHFGTKQQLDRAKQDFQRAIELLELQTGSAPVDSVIDRAQLLVNMGVLQRRSGDPKQSLESYEAAIKLLKGLEPLAADHLDRRVSLAQAYKNVGLLLYSQGQFETAEPHYREALDIRRQLAAEFPVAPQYLGEWAEAISGYSSVLQRTGKRNQAITEIRQAVTVLERLVSNHPDQVIYRIDLGGSLCNAGIMIRDSGSAQESINWFDRAVETLAPIVEKDSTRSEARQYLLNSLFSRARTLMMLELYKRSIPDWDRILELDPSSVVSRIRRATCLAYVDPAQAAIVADELALDPKARYDAACILAICSGKSEAEPKATYAASSLKILQQIRDNNEVPKAQLLQKLKADTSFDSMRSEPEFSDFLQSLDSVAWLNEFEDFLVPTDCQHCSICA